MEAAERSLAHAARAFGGGALRRRGWLVEATGLAGGGHDAVITCTFGDNRGVRATLALHSREEAVTAAMIARAILDRFTVLDREITERWYEEIGVR